MYNDDRRVEFDPAKNRLNRAKHGIDLADVETVFADDFAITIEDELADEERWVTLGADGFGRILVVVYTWRDPATIRIISARRAGAAERAQYEANA